MMGNTLTLAVLSVTGLGFWLKCRNKSSLPLPLGLPADPIIGHLRLIPPEAPADKLAEWGRMYGDVIHLRVLNRDLIILNTAEVASDLTDKRSENYNDRSYFPVLEQVKEETKVNPRWQRVAYGHEINSNDDPYLKIAEDSGYALTHCGPVGATPVDLLPILQYFPSCFPGVYFAGQARIFSKYIQKLHECPFSEVRKAMAAGTAKPSFLSYDLERLHREGNETPEEFVEVKGAVAVVYCAGTDTTWANLSIFMLAMTLHPECQVRAHGEIDAHVDGSRLSEMTNRESLPFIDCILNETYRWLNAVPSGVPHKVVEDDVYRGMLIPKLGALIFANIRICPGRHLADTSHLIAIATILSLYEIKARGPDGKEIIPEIALESGFTVHPKPYECVVQTRNERARKLVK
ncbi:hypothetical protein NP233_g2019 [Leucocoprinus birnbaumii]|uniref:Cytochrome P450 n=1 Tax=Leucocoprinus birnbaumii TaxID=56174 RepID=A0AAD5YZC0_9AGAR|nr:hypothetical protein NP233_g2019 [Leucocoprinus birnbaumii]